ncbi:hypothetical protein Pelo_19049 [Pelomyxa schiedti]|nr:hypothetical protein Pelo_19049 [Pelomyxa schiedti]
MTETSVHTETNAHTTADPTLTLRQQVESLKASVGELTKQNEQLQCENRQCRANLKEALDCYQTISRNVSRLETLHQESIVAATSSLTTSTNHP